jgi:hypothetical protein
MENVAGHPVAGQLHVFAHTLSQTHTCRLCIHSSSVFQRTRLKQQYVADIHGLTFYLSTVGDVINAAQRNADALAGSQPRLQVVRVTVPTGRASEPRMAPLPVGQKHDGLLDYWGLEWPVGGPSESDRVRV